MYVLRKVRNLCSIGIVYQDILENLKINLTSKINGLPASPGVYQFKDKSDNIIYIGKAKDLKKRVKS
ncbi:MAG: GIY-YIG nuclease family protein, partial [Candidatus Neomarinimicrobiota bacterium]|nr:GIY-YIG nuclease family protein [Candidatus Neomarinimicrobiota bacterium]